jgi:hypothetical protein
VSEPNDSGRFAAIDGADSDLTYLRALEVCCVIFHMHCGDAEALASILEVRLMSHLIHFLFLFIEDFLPPFSFFKEKKKGKFFDILPIT